MYVDRFNIPSEYLTGHFPVGFLVCGLAVLVLGIVVVVRMVRLGHFTMKGFDQEGMRFLPRMALIPIGIALMVFAFLESNSSRVVAKNLLLELHSSETKMAEGHVRVLHESPGHDSGDRIEVADYSFLISGSRLSRFYHQTIEQGGILTEGRDVRIFFLVSNGENYEESKIIRIQEKIKQD
jgi:hypothetical protein